MPFYLAIVYWEIPIFTKYENDAKLLIPMENSGILQLSGFITDFSIWDKTIDIYASRFHEQFAVYPNILLAHTATYQKIDLYAQKHPNRIVMFDDDGGGFETIETSNEPYEGLSHFTAEDYTLELCLDYDLGEGYFTLVFDETPDFDGEPEEKPEPQGNIYQYRKTA